MSFTNKEGKSIVLNIIDTIQKHEDYLSEIDGAIDDGDYGTSMNKEVTIAKSQVDKNEILSEALCALSCVLMEKIGGPMGPLYGSIFMGMQTVLGNVEYINGAIIEKMLKQAYDNIQMISPAKPGDKTLVDVPASAVSAYVSVFEKTQDIRTALTACSQAAEKGMQAACDMQAKLGRASHLREKSIGHQNTGATSCCLTLQTFCSTIIALEKASREEAGDAAIC